MCFINKSAPPPLLRKQYYFFWKLDIWKLYGLNSTLILPVCKLHQSDIVTIIRIVMNTIIICNIARTLVHNVQSTSALFLQASPLHKTNLNTFSRECQFVSQVSDKVFCLLFQSYVPCDAWVRWFDFLLHVLVRKTVYGILSGASLKLSASCMWRSFNERTRKNVLSLSYAIKINNTSPESDRLRRFYIRRILHVF